MSDLRRNAAEARSFTQRRDAWWAAPAQLLPRVLWSRRGCGCIADGKRGYVVEVSNLQSSENQVPAATTESREG